ncbi:MULTISPECIES: hypothetical protein [Streptosporangium]|uniref:DUF4352 domain-containing protein n=1 Tax=Streptosporangium brasiliense TaxID=47480 RepID=A0ABT9R1Y0_9ACTN|nr:hypothetical protein [Streptosporangium brasiliense]MDP9863236.1 hypothetical protein [Streptosporangium brasiliense]
MTSTETPARPEQAAGRRAPAPPSRWRRAGVLSIGVALAAAAVGLQTLGLDRDARTAHLTWTGGVGEEVSASRFSARVKAVHAAKAIEATGLSGAVERATTSGIFLIAEVGATANREPQKFATPTLLVEDGKRYAATDKVDASKTITNPFIQVGWWAESVAIFEVPVAALPGSRLVLAPKNGFIGEALLPEVEIDLGLDESAAQRLISNAKDVYQLASKK